MNSDPIFGPFFAMMVLTFAVWIAMYVRRLRYIAANRIDTQKLTTPEKGSKLIPEEVSWPAHNLRNLFEAPVLFYAISLYLFVTNNVDGTAVVCAWIFFGLRAAHSLVHCTINKVRLRFVLYVLSKLVLWFMIFRAAAQFFFA